jgi:hypothetical protein
MRLQGMAADYRWKPEAKPEDAGLEARLEAQAAGGRPGQAERAAG